MLEVKYVFLYSGSFDFVEQVTTCLIILRSVSQIRNRGLEFMCDYKGDPSDTCTTNSRQGLRSDETKSDRGIVHVVSIESV